MGQQKILPWILALLLSGCFNRVPPHNELCKSIRRAHALGNHKDVIDLALRLEINYPESLRIIDILILSMKSHLILGKTRQSKFYLTEGIKLADFIIVADKEKAIENDIYMLRIRAYFESIDWNISRSDSTVQSTLSAIEEYRKIASKNLLSSHEKELFLIENKCKKHLYNKAIHRASVLLRQDNWSAALNQIESDLNIRNQNDNPQTIYMKMCIRNKMHCDAEELLALLRVLNKSCRNSKDMHYLRLGFDLVNMHHSKLTELQTKEFHMLCSESQKHDK